MSETTFSKYIRKSIKYKFNEEKYLKLNLITMVLFILTLCTFFIMNNIVFIGAVSLFSIFIAVNLTEIFDSTKCFLFFNILGVLLLIFFIYDNFNLLLFVISTFILSVIVSSILKIEYNKLLFIVIFSFIFNFYLFPKFLEPDNVENILRKMAAKKGNKIYERIF